jgi:ParB/RepB/Spo0J family partition protein
MAGKTLGVLEVRLVDVIIDAGFNFRTGGVDESGEYFKGIVESIREEGLKEPIVVTRGKDGKLHLCEGEHRLRAMRKLGIERSTVVVRAYENEAERFVESVIPNIVRARARPYDVASACVRLRAFGYNRAKISRTLGLGETYIGSLLGCMDRLEPELLDMFKKNDSAATVADMISASRMDSEEQLKWYDDVRFGRFEGEEEKQPRTPRDGAGRPRMRSRDKMKIALANLRGAPHIGTSRKQIVATDDVREAVALFARWAMGELETCPIPEPEIEKD